MENKVLLYDVNDVKIGETFMRRARQLVKQQRAVWTDESQSAIRFAPDMEDWETSAAVPLDLGETDDKLVMMAEKRIVERRQFLIHSIAFVPMAFFITVAAFAFRSDIFIAFALGGWIMAYGAHGCVFAIRSYPSFFKNERKAKLLAAEVDMLKSEMKR